jgi:hypothetical protein
MVSWLLLHFQVIGCIPAANGLYQHCGKYDYKEDANIVKITSETSKNEYLET